jgi:hypothetical protein
MLQWSIMAVKQSMTVNAQKNAIILPTNWSAIESLELKIDKDTKINFMDCTMA